MGGYWSPAGGRAIWDLGRETAYGVVIRSPAQTLLGFNWLAPGTEWRIAIGSALGGLLLTLAFASRPGPSKNLKWLGYGWMVVAVLPAHILSLIGPGLTNSRILYLGSAGLALLLAVVSAQVEQKALREAVVVALAVVFSLGLLSNLSPWRRASGFSAEFQHAW